MFSQDALVCHNIESINLVIHRERNFLKNSVVLQKLTDYWYQNDTKNDVFIILRKNVQG